MTLLPTFALALAAPAVQDHSPLHPPEASLFVQVPDIPALVDAYSQSAYAKLLGDPELQAAVAQVMGQEDFDPMAMLMAEWESAEQNGDIPEIRPLLKSLRAFSASFSIKGHDLAGFVQAAERNDPSEGVNWLGLDVVVDFADTDSANAAIELLQELLGSDAEDLVEGTMPGPEGDLRVWTVKEEDAIAQTFRLVHNGPRLQLRLGGVGAESFQTRLAGQGQALSGRMGSAAKALGAPQGTVLANFQNRIGDQVLDLLESQADLQGSSGFILQIAEAMAGPGISMIVRGGDWRISAKDGRFVTQGVYPTRTKSELDEAMGATALSSESLALVHPETIAAGVVSIDSDKLSSFLNRMLQQEGAPNMEEIEQQFGFHPVRDLIAPLDSAAAWSLQGNIGLSAPPFQMSASVSDPEAMRRGITGLANMMGAMGGEDVNVSSRPYRGYDLVTFKFNSDEFEGSGLPINPLDMFQPTLMVMDDRVVMTLNSIQAKREVKRVLKAEDSLHPQLGGDMIPAGAGEVGFADWIAVVGRLYSAGKTFAPMMAGEVPFDLAALPAAELITRHFQPSRDWKRRVDGQVQYFGESSFGPEWTGAMLGGVMGTMWSMPRMVSQSELMIEPSIEAPPPHFHSTVEDKRAAAMADIKAIHSAVQQYSINNAGRLPASLDVLVVKDANGASYLDSDQVPSDPWGTTYQYWTASDGPQFAVWSAGPNGQNEDGEGDDIVADV